MKTPTRRPGAEAAIGMINVVFLLLIFFLIAGTIANPPDPEVRLVSITEGDPLPPHDALVLTAEGELRHLGAAATVEDYLATLTEEPRVARILPDREAPALRLVVLGQELSAGGAERVLILGERTDE